MPKPRFALTCPGARKVFLAGDFNGWHPEAQRMKRAKKGKDTFVASLDLAPGCYQYKYVADGKWCCDDGDCVPNDLGTSNNVVQVCG